MFGEVCSNFSYNFHWNNETFAFDHELECTVSRTVFVLFSFIGIAGLIGNALVVLGELRILSTVTKRGINSRLPLFFQFSCGG